MPREIRFAKVVAPRHQLVLYSQSLDEIVGPDAPVRVLWALLDAVDWMRWESRYTGVGQPPIHPQYMAAAILYGMMKRIRSSRALEEAARKHVDFMWLLQGFEPDHSTFADFFNRHGNSIKDLNRQIATSLLKKGREALVHLIIDGTRLRANSDRHRTRTAGFLEKLIAELDARYEQLREEVLTAAQTGPCDDGASTKQMHEHLARLDKEMAKLQAQRDKYKKALAIAQERDERSEEHNGKKAKPVRVSPTDSEAHVVPNKDGGCAPNHTPIAAVEPQTGAIVHSDVLADSDEAGAVMPAVQSFEELVGQKPQAVLADSNFAAGEVLEALDGDGIEALMPNRSMSPPDNPALREDPTTPVPEQDRSRLPKQGKQFARTAFVYDEQNNVYYCPMGHALTPCRHGARKNGVTYTLYRCGGCNSCPLAQDCIQGKNKARTITRDQYETLREQAVERLSTPEGKETFKSRAPGIETVFGFIKGGWLIRQFLHRGLDKVRAEWNWICTAYNLKKLMALVGQNVLNAPGAPSCRPKNVFLALFTRFERPKCRRAAQNRDTMRWEIQYGVSCAA